MLKSRLDKIELYYENDCETIEMKMIASVSICFPSLRHEASSNHANVRAQVRRVHLRLLVLQRHCQQLDGGRHVQDDQGRSG